MMKDRRKAKFPQWKRGITDEENVELERLERRRAVARLVLKRLSKDYNRIVQRAACRAKNTPVSK